MTSNIEPVHKFLGLSAGEIAVAIFFVISGYLITISAQQRSLLEFVVARALRILPALIIVTLFAVLVVGPIFTTLPLGIYATSPMTLDYLGNAYVFGLSFSLPGVFTTLPVSSSVNGSLWTLPLEVSIDGVVAILTTFRLANNRASLVVAGLFVAGLAVASLRYGLWWDQRGPGIYSIQLYPFLRYGVFFFVGAGLSFWKDRIPLWWPLALGITVLWITSAYFRPLWVVYFIALPYLVLYVAFTIPAAYFLSIGVLSYGTYLCALPIQQSVVQIFGMDMGPWGLMLVAIPIILTLAYLSWWLVEKPSLEMKKSLLKIRIAPNSFKLRLPDLFLRKAVAARARL